MSKKVAVIGSGIAGIASAIRLAVKGYSVTVFEKNSYPGGKLTSFKLSDYRFDAGPSLFTMPHFVEELFQISDKNISDYFEYSKEKNSCHYFWNDGDQFIAPSNPVDFANEASNHFKEEKKNILKKFEKAAWINKKIGPLFLEQSLHKFGNFTNLATAKSLIQLRKFDINKSLDDVNRRDLNNPKLIQLFNRFATYNGSSPFQTPGIMGVIPHYEHNVGTFFPKGGMQSITNSLVQLAFDLGVNFHFNTKVDKINLDHSQKLVKSLSFNDEERNFDTVVSNSDVYFVYENLIPGYKKPSKILNSERSSSALIFYWGIKKSFKNLGLHNIFFADDYAAEFETIFETNKAYQDPTIYVHISSKCNQTDAPSGKENWFVMINTPPKGNINWDEFITNSKKNITKKLSKNLGEDISQLIECQEILDPRTIESKTLSYQGALYGTSSNSKYAAFLRHPNFNGIKNLYFVGGSAHPGGGIPLCLQSAKIIAQYA